MKSIGIFFGTDTGNTEKVAKKIFKIIKKDYPVKISNIVNTSKKEIEKFKFLIFGIPTWYYGEVQSDWDNFFPILKKINFLNKFVSIFGCGDQEDYGEYFCDAIGILRKILIKRKATIIGEWPVDGYNFINSKALTKDKKNFFGLALDLDRQPELTNNRIKKWVKNIILSFNSIKIS